jgi:homoprotocatechuate degradation regulator HpaR
MRGVERREARCMKRSAAASAATSRVRMRDVSKSLPLALMRAREATMLCFRPHLRNLEVTEQQWRVLRVLYAARVLDVTTLARRAVLHAPSLTRILRELKRQRLIARRQGAGDRRRQEVMLTATGRKLLARGASGSEAGYRKIATRFGAKRLRKLFDLLAQLEESLRREEKEQ